MGLPEVSIKRPVLASMMSLGLIVFGLVGLGRLPVRELPDVDPPIVNVTTIYPGANATVVETQVTELLEEAINSIPGIKTLTSESREQVSGITIEFNLARPIEDAAQDVRDRVARVRDRLPEDIDEPVVAKQESDAQPCMWVALYSDRLSTLELTTFAERVLKDRLQTVPGVSSVLLGGAKRFAIRLWLDADLMAAHQVTVLDIERALREQSIELPSGRVENWQRALSIQTLGELKTPEEYNQLIVRRDGTTLVRLRDVGRAAVGVEDVHAAARYNSRPAMGLGIVKQSKANTIDVVRGVKAELRQLRGLLPDGVLVDVPYDESIYIERAIQEVWETLFISFLLVLATIYVFLRDLRSTFVPSVTIPVAIIATFGVLYACHYSINIVTMLALVLAIGVVVDDSIVVLENIYRHVEAGQPPFQAALTSMREITFAVIATTVALVAVFVPLAFQTTLTGRLFVEFAVAIACSVMFSGFVALTLTPMIAARLLRPPAAAGERHRVLDVFERWLTGLTRWYERRLRWALRHRALVLIGSALSVAAALGLYTQLEQEFLPTEDKGRLFCIVIAPEGATADYTDRMVRQLETIVRAQPEVQGYFSAVALARGGPGRTNEGLAFIRLKERRARSVQDMVDGPHGLGAQFFREIEGAIAIPIVPKAIGRGFGQTFQLVLQHHDLSTLDRAAQALSNQLRGVDYLLNVRSQFELSKPELRVTIDRDRAAALGVSIADLSRTLQILFGGLDLSTVKLEGKEYDVIAQLERTARLMPADLERLYVRSATGQLIQLGSIVRSSVGGGPSGIHHYNRFRAATVEATPTGVPLGTAMARTEALLPRALPPEMRYEWAGEARDLREAGTQTFFVLLLALAIIYMVLAAQFESLIHPLTVMLSVPLAALGAFGALWVMSLINQLGTMLYGWSHYAPDPPAIAGWLSRIVPRVPAMGINLFSQIGMILLLGLVTKNAILLVDFANQQMAQGQPAREAMIAAGRIRLRPILMTATTTIVGMIPLVIGFGAGAESRRPMGVAAAGGMLVSTVLTLFVVPVVYTVFGDLEQRVKRRRAAAPPEVSGHA